MKAYYDYEALAAMDDSPSRFKGGKRQVIYAEEEVDPWALIEPEEDELETDEINVVGDLSYAKV
jgi:hypothetical protein